MTPTEIKEYYGTCRAFAKKTKISRQSIMNWIKRGYIPFDAQHKLEIITEGLFKADWNHGQASLAIKNKKTRSKKS